MPAFDEPDLDRCISRRKGVAKHTPFSGLGPVPVHWGDVRCRGDEENILLCRKDVWRGGPCPPELAAAVRCSLAPGKRTCALVSLPRVSSTAADGQSTPVKSLPAAVQTRTPESPRPSAVIQQESPAVCVTAQVPSDLTFDVFHFL